MFVTCSFIRQSRGRRVVVKGYSISTIGDSRIFYRMASAKKTSKSLVSLQNSTEKNRNYSNSLQIQTEDYEETSDVGADKLLISKVISFATEAHHMWIKALPDTNSLKESIHIEAKDK
ncbi:Uncharacterised protein [Escherichia coli]|nr:Uncharacterised protein [Escherichia coli]